MYIDYTIRGQVTESLNVAAGAKTAVASYYQEHGTFPADNTAAALVPAASIQGSYVDSVSVAGPVISVRFGNKANSLIAGETITLTAGGTAGSLTWACASGGVIQVRHLPKSCL